MIPGSSAPSSPDLVGRVLGGRYRLTAILGGGASAAVFAAEDVILKRQVAVKVLHPALAADDAFLRRFQTEAQVAAALRHPNVLLVHDWGNDGGSPYLVTELLEGGSLKRLLDGGFRATPSQALQIGLEACRGLDHAHRRGMVHRDVKPANLLLDLDGQLRVADFGLAGAIADAAVTEPLGAVLGTARYASPEQVEGRPLDGRSDVYSLALVLVEIITGEAPFAADTSAATLLARLERNLEPPAAVGALAAALAAAGRTDRDSRSTAANFGRMLKAAAAELDRPDPLPLAELGRLVVGSPADDETAHPASVIPAPVTQVLYDADLDDPDEDAATGAEAAADLQQPGGAIPSVPLTPTPLFPPARLDIPPPAVEPNPLAPATPLAEPTPFAAPTPPAEASPLAVSAGPAAPADPKAPAPWAPPADPAPSAPSAPMAKPAPPVAPATAPVPIVVPAGRKRGDPAAPIAPVATVATKPRRRARLLLLLVLVLLVAGLAAAAAVAQPWRKTVDVPQLVGLTRNDAVARLQPERLSLKVAGRSPSETVEAGRVLSARPARQRQGKAVSVTLSSGPEERVLPAVAGRQVDEVTKELTSLGLVVVPNPIDSETVAIGTTLSVAPEAGSRVARGATVTLGVSAGPPARPIPDVTGMALAEATAALQTVGLKATSVEVFDGKVPAGKVVSTSPASGTAARVGQVVTVNVSKGPDLVGVPAVSGRTPQAAQQAMTAAGLVVSATYGPPAGKVFSSQPAAGAKVRRGSSVALYTK